MHSVKSCDEFRCIKHTNIGLVMEWVRKSRELRKMLHPISPECTSNEHENFCWRYFSILLEHANELRTIKSFLTVAVERPCKNKLICSQTHCYQHLIFTSFQFTKSHIHVEFESQWDVQIPIPIVSWAVLHHSVQNIIRLKWFSRMAFGTCIS